MAALPDEVGGAVLATAEAALLLDGGLSQIMIRNGASNLVNWGHTYKAIEGYDLRVNFIATSAFHL
jgi:hypothetical protein